MRSEATFVIQFPDAGHNLPAESYALPSQLVWSSRRVLAKGNGGTGSEWAVLNSGQMRWMLRGTITQIFNNVTRMRLGWH